MIDVRSFDADIGRTMMIAHIYFPPYPFFPGMEKKKKNLKGKKQIELGSAFCLFPFHVSPKRTLAPPLLLFTHQQAWRCTSGWAVCVRIAAWMSW